MEKKKSKLVWWKVALGYILLIIFCTSIISFIDSERMFYNLAAGIIVSWIIALVLYYFWAIYFYNVNMGWEDDDWEKLEEKKQGQSGLLDDEPTVNPNAGETLGLPPGTVRATIALTLLVAAMALMLASLDLPHELEQNSLFIDNYEFMKTAFLMMVAFYFGNKSFEVLNKQNKESQKTKAVGPFKQLSDAPAITSPISGSQAKDMLKNAEDIEILDDENFDDEEAAG